MNYSRIALLGGLAAAILPAGCFSSSGRPGGKGWTCQTCDNKAVIEQRYIDGSKNIADLCLKDEGDVVHHLEQEPMAVGAFHGDGRLGFHLENSEGLVHWVKTDDFTGRGYKVRRVTPAGMQHHDRFSQGT